MPYFSYVAIDNGGARVRGGIEGESAESVRKFLSMNGMVTVDVRKTGIWNMDMADIGLFKRRLKKKDIAYICRQLAYVLRSGLSLSAGFDVIIENAPNREMKKLLAGMRVDIMRGAGIGACFRNTGVLPAFLCSMADVGEKTDSLDNIMHDMAEFYENDARTAAQVSTMLLYPAFIAAALVIVVVAALVFVVPGYAATFLEADAVLPMPTRILIGMSDFFIAYRFALLIGAALTAVFLAMLLKTHIGRYVGDYLRLRNILTGSFNIKSMNLYFAESMSILLSSQSDVLASLEAVKGILGNALYDAQLDRIIGSIRNGTRLSAALGGSRLFCVMLRSMVGLGEDTDSLPSALDECAKYLREELDISVNRLKSLVQPVSTIILGLILGFIVMAIMLPSIQMTSFY